MRHLIFGTFITIATLSTMTWAAPSRGPSMRILQHPKDYRMAKIDLRNVNVWGGARGMVKKNLSINVPIGMGARFSRAVAAGNVKVKGDAFGELFISAGRGANTMIIHRNDGYRFQMGVGSKATSHWFGRVPDGNQIGDGKFVGRSGATTRGATLIDPVTLNKDATSALDGKTKMWWARPSRPHFDQKQLQRYQGSSSAQTITQISTRIAEVNQLAALANFKGVTAVTTAEVRKAGRPTPLWDIKMVKMKAAVKKQGALRMAGYCSVPVGSKPLLSHYAPGSCTLSASRMAIATAVGKIVPEGDILKLATGYNRKGGGGMAMCSLPGLFTQFGVKTDIKYWLKPASQLTMLEKWTSTPHRTAVISLSSRDGIGGHAVVVDSVTRDSDGYKINIRDNGYDGRQRTMSQGEFIKRTTGDQVLVGK